MTEFDSVIPAGQSGTLTAKMKTTTSQSGAVSKSIAVTTDAPGAERVTLSMTFRLVTAVSVLPRPQMSLNGVQGDDLTGTLIVRRGDGKRLEVTGVESREHRLVFTTQRVDEEVMVGKRKAIAGDVLLTASPAEGVEPVTATGVFKIQTNHPDAPSIDVRYSLRMRPVIEARPAQLRLLLQEGNSQGRTMLFRIHHNRQGEFKLTGAEPSNPEIFRVQLVDGDRKQVAHSIAVMLQDNVQPGAIEARQLESLSITTDDSIQPEITIPVLIEPRAMRKPSQRRPLQ